MSESPDQAAAEDPPSGGQARPHSGFRIWAEVAGVWAISLAWPLYSRIASGPEALTSYGVRRLDLVLLILAVSLLGPLVIALCELVIRRLFDERRRRVVHGAVIGALLSLVLWKWTLDHGWPGFARNLLPLLSTAAIAWLYVRTELVRNFALMLSFATVVVIGAFALQYPIRDELLPHEAKAATGAIESDTPVVLVVFDELPLAALERPDGTIDPRFPAFAELSRRANWYPEAISVADQTVFALPSILTGEDPESNEEDRNEPPAPGLGNYPDSICRIARDGGYEVNAYEPVTDLCEPNWNLGTRITATIRRALTMKGDQAALPWLPGGLEQKAENALGTFFDTPWTEYGSGRREAFEEFTAGLKAGNRTLNVLHSTLPHIRWIYSPDGSQYTDIRGEGDTMLVNPPTQGEVDRNAQQMMLQLQFTDRELGRLIGKMKAEGTWDDALLVVTADHGAGFQKGWSRRMLNVLNQGWIVPVPLFIKFPGQQHGSLVRGTADGRDIAPTVMANLGLDPLESMTGRDLTGLRRLPRRQKADVVATIGGPTEIDLGNVDRDRIAASRYFQRLLGRSFYAPGGHADLLGRKPSRLREMPAVAFDPSLYEDVDTSSDRIPANFQARIDPPGGLNPGPLAITLNGRIAATARPWPSEEGWQVGAVLPTDGFRDGGNEIRVYEIGSRD